MKRGHNASGGNSPSKKPKNKLYSLVNNDSQLVKIRGIEEKLSKIISTMEPSVPKLKSSGGAERRLNTISKMASRLEDYFQTVSKKTPSDPSTISSDSDTLPEPISSEVIETIESETQATSQKKKSSSKYRNVYSLQDLQHIYQNHFTKYFILRIPIEYKRKLNPYKIIDEIKKETGEAPKRVSGNNVNSFTIEIASEMQSNKISDLPSIKIDDIDCNISLFSTNPAV